MLFLLTDSLQKLKLEKNHGYFNNSFLWSPSSPQLHRPFFKKTKNKNKKTNNQYSASD